MGTKYKKYCRLTFLFIFLFIVLSFNFLHTEKTITKDDDCPACHFQHSSLSTAQISFFSLNPPAFFGILKSFEYFNYTFIFSITPNSRSPPQI